MPILCPRGIVRIPLHAPLRAPSKGSLGVITRAPNRIVKNQRQKTPWYPPCASWMESFNEGSKIIGQGIIYFTMFYCSMNWMYYRGLRKSIEEFKAENEADEGDAAEDDEDEYKNKK